MAKTYPLRDILRKSLKLLGFLAILYALAAGAMLALAATASSYYEAIRLDQPLPQILDEHPDLQAREIGVPAAIRAMPPAWLPERTGTVGGVKAARGVELFFLDPMFNITVILDDQDRVMIKHPTFEGG